MSPRAALSAALALAAPASAWAPNYAHAGAWVGSSLESTPLWFRGRLYMMQSQMRNFLPDNKGHGFWCLFDGVTGEELVCPPSSSGHAFCSAVVDATPGREETMFVFCSAWDRANHDCPTPQWGCGACSDPWASGGCYVGAWACAGDDVAACAWDASFNKALVLPGNETVPNVGVGLVPAGAGAVGALGPHQAFMALETATSVAVNVGTDGDLTRNWRLLDRAAFRVDGVSDGGLCPFARFDAATRHYYVGGGGNNVNLMRSPNLTAGSWEAPPAGRAIAQGCARGAEDCAPGSPVARIAGGYYTQYWANGSDHNDRLFLSNLTDWNWSVNDADVTFNGTHTLFICAGGEAAAAGGRAPSAHAPLPPRRHVRADGAQELHRQERQLLPARRRQGDDGGVAGVLLGVIRNLMRAPPLTTAGKSRAPQSGPTRRRARQTRSRSCR